MKQEVPVVWEENWLEKNHRFKAWKNHAISQRKELLPQKLVLLLSSDSNLNSAASHKSMTQLDVKNEAFWGKDVISNKIISPETLD